MRLRPVRLRTGCGALLGLVLAGQAAAQTVVSYAGPPVAIPDDFPNGVGVAFEVSGLGLVTDIDVRFDASQGCDASVGNPAAAINHTFVGDLIIKLRSPAGTEVMLYDRRGGTRENICALLLDDDGGFPPLATLTSQGGQPVAGSFTPDAPLSTLDGESANGLWSLVVSDNAGMDIGTLNRFSLLIRSAPVPEIDVDVLDDPFPGGCAPASCSLREAVSLANGRAGLDRIRLPAGTLQLTRLGAGEDANFNGDLDVTDELEVVGAGRDLTTLTQTEADRLFDVRTLDTSLALRRIKLTGGNVSGNGGAVAFQVRGTLTIEDADLTGHRATRLGGAIYHVGSGSFQLNVPRLVLRRVLLDDNRATNAAPESAYGGAVYSVSSGGADPYVVIEGSTFSNNRADNGAGALALDGIQSVSSNSVRIGGSAFTRNAVTLSGRGGAIASQVAENGLVRVRIADSVFSMNAVPSSATTNSGGAISVGFSELVSVERSMFELNAARTGGAIAGAGGEITDSTFCNNQAVDAGGALVGVDVTVRRSTFCDNEVTTADAAQVGGGAIAASGAELFIERSTLSGNRALRGAGITMGIGDLFLRNNTIVAPSPLPVGALGSVLRHNGTATTDTLSLINNIMIGQCSYLTPGLVPDVAFSNSEASGNTCRLLLGALQAGNQTAVAGAAINLGPLADNGGPTDTHLPVAPSIAIDAAQQLACTALDQRGYQRTDAICDRGSVEASGQPVPDAVFANGFE